MNRHFKLLDAVNNATTEEEHRAAESFLNGWRAGVRACGLRWSGIDADLHTMEKFGSDRPMCCGVLLDWKPA